MALLIITLLPTPADASAVLEAVRSDDGTTVARTLQAPLALLPAHGPAQGLELVALVPMTQLSWHTVTLPRGSLGARVRTVLEGLLEDRLLDEPSALHFALEPGAREGVPVRVATCNSHWLSGWMAALEQAGLAVSRIVPELSPSDDPTVAPVLLVSGNAPHATLARVDWHGVTLLPATAANAALAGASAQEPATVLAEPSAAALAEQLFHSPATLQSPAQRALAAAQSPWDLAQFSLLRTRGTRTRKRLNAWSHSLLQAPQWRAARWAVVALVAVNLVGLQAWAWKEKTEQAAKRAAIQSVLVTTFPDVRVVVDAPLQMARALADLQRQSGTAASADLETLLVQYQAAAPGTPAPAAIEFIANELQIKAIDGSTQVVQAAQTTPAERSP
jgi:general secretion pathway protein L